MNKMIVFREENGIIVIKIDGQPPIAHDIADKEELLTKIAVNFFKGTENSVKAAAKKTKRKPRKSKNLPLGFDTIVPQDTTNAV